MPSPSGSGSAKSGSTFGNDLFGYLIHLATLYQRPPGKLVFSALSSCVLLLLGAPVVPGSNSHQLGALFEELYKDPAVVAYVYSRLNGIGKVGWLSFSPLKNMHVVTYMKILSKFWEILVGF